MKRNKKSFFNAVAAVMMTAGSGLCAMVFTKFVLIYFGSDFNGLNSTANQVVTILNLLEGGFTVATNVALFRPYFDKDYDKVNGIISATAKSFRRIGLAALGVGIVISVGYSFVIQSDLARPLVFTVLFLTLLPVCFNFYYATKYRILLQAEQSEYVISLCTMTTNIMGYAVNIVAMRLGSSIWTVRVIIMCFALLNSLLIGLYVRKKFPHIRFNAEPDRESVKGTGDVFVQKLTGVVYSTAPIVCITLTPGGTMLASVYAVYNNVFSLLKGVMHAVIDAPRLSIGELAAEDGKKDRLWEVFNEYEYIIQALLLAVLSTAAALILPFIRIYTAGVTDINYNQPLIAVLLVLISMFELLHMPSGHIINMTGRFRTSKRIQLIAIGIMGLGIGISFIFGFGVIGILASVLATAISLCFMEIGWVHLQFFRKNILPFLLRSLVFAAVGTGIVFAETKLIPETLNGYIRFFITAVVVCGVNCILTAVTAFLLNPVCTKHIILRVWNMAKSIIHK